VTRRSLNAFAVLLLPLVLAGGMSVQSVKPSNAPATPPRLIDTLSASEANWHLTIGTDAPFVFVGDLVALHIRYVNIAIPLTTVTVSPTDRLAFEPAIQMPCAGCRELTLRALAPGAVRIDARTYGEVYYPPCGCPHFILIAADKPVDVIVKIPASRLFIPAIQVSDL
jgi:hypothetical protein